VPTRQQIGAIANAPHRKFEKSNLYHRLRLTLGLGSDLGLGLALEFGWGSFAIAPGKLISKQDNVDTNTESVRCISIVYSMCPYKCNQ